jgi:hypothetical protein
MHPADVAGGAKESEEPTIKNEEVKTQIDSSSTPDLTGL